MDAALSTRLGEARRSLAAARGQSAVHPIASPTLPAAASELAETLQTIASTCRTFEGQLTSGSTAFSIKALLVLREWAQSHAALPSAQDVTLQLSHIRPRVAAARVPPSAKRTLEAIARAAVAVGLDVFEDPPMLYDPPSELTLSGQLVVIDVSLAHPGSAVGRVRLAYGPEGTTDEGIERVLTRALDGIDSADWLAQQAALERFRRALDALVTLERAGIEAFAASAALAAAFERDEATLTPPIPLRGELGHPYLSFLLHADAIVRISDAWRTAAESAFAGAGLEALVRSRSDDIVLGWIEPLGTAFQLRLEPPVPLSDHTARQLAGILGVALAEGGSVFGKESSAGPRLHELILGDYEASAIYDTTFDDAPTFRFSLASTSARGHLLEAVRFASADQLNAIVVTLSSQCRDNELVRSCFAGPLVRRLARAAEPTPSLDELLGDAPPGWIAVELHLPTASNDDMLLISMLTPGPARLAKPATIALRSSDDLVRRQIVDLGGSVPLLCRWLAQREAHQR